MSCGGSHLGFQIVIKNRKFVEDLPMIIPAKSQFNWFSGFQGFNQSEHVIGPGSHVEFPIYTNLVEDHPMNIYGKFG
jgi:hypothetical protein